MHPFKKIIAAYIAQYNTAQSVVPAQTVPTRSAEKSFVCELCKRSFKQSSELKKHKETFHSRTCTNICKVCDKHMENAASLTRHMMTHMGAYRSNRSDFYDKKFGQVYSANPHAKLNHPNQQMCGRCGNRFNKSFQLRRHARRHSPSETLHTCDTCSKSFISPANLERHSLIHINSKSHNANKCNISRTTAFGNYTTAKWKKNQRQSSRRPIYYREYFEARFFRIGIFYC